MSRRTLTLVIVMCAVSFLPLVAQADDPPPPATSSETPQLTPLKAVVTIAPLRGLVEPLLPPGSTIDMLIPPGVSEHGYEIPPQKLAAITRADVVVLVGLNLEPQVEKFLSNNTSADRLVITMAELCDVKADPDDHSGHRHGPNGECLHGSVDPHLWLDPVLARTFVEKFAQRLAERSPVEGAAEHPVLTTAKKVTARIDEIDAAYRRAADSAETRTIVVGHDAYGWLARRYSLNTIAIAGLNAQEPTNKAIQSAIAAIRTRGAKAVFVEPQLPQAAGKRIAQRTKVPVLTIDPLGSGDWIAMMESNLEALKKGLGQKPAKPE